MNARKARRRRAQLPGIAELGRHRGYRGSFQIDITEDHDRRMAAELQRHLLHGLHGQRTELLAFNNADAHDAF